MIKFYALASLLFCGQVVAQIAPQYMVGEIDPHFLKQAMEGKPLSVPQLELTAFSKVGHVGELMGKSYACEFTTYKVLQQVDDGTLVDVNYFRPSRTMAVQLNPAKYETYPSRSVTLGPYLFKSPSLSRMPSDAVFAPRGLWKITGTYDYATVLGASKTVLVVEPMAEDEIKVPEHPELLIGEFREWSTNGSGSPLKAIYIGYEKLLVKLMDASGETIQVRINKLTSEEQRWVRRQIKEGLTVREKAEIRAKEEAKRNKQGEAQEKR